MIIYILSLQHDTTCDICIFYIYIYSIGKTKGTIRDDLMGDLGEQTLGFFGDLTGFWFTPLCHHYFQY